MPKNFYKEFHKNRKTRVCNILIDNERFEDFQYNSVSSFHEKLMKTGNIISANNMDDRKITIKFFSNKGVKITLNYYGLLEYLLFINGIQTTLHI